MADITLRLIWYKLGEVSGKMAEAGRTWYTELDFDSYVLDLLLFGWCATSIVVVLVVNAVVTAFGPLQKQPKDWDSRGREPREGESLTGAPLPIESAKWFNNALNWFYLHYYYSPEFIDDWLKSLNEQLLKLGGPVQAKFERIQNGSLPPRVTHVSCEASPSDTFIIHAKLESRDLSFVVFASQQTHEGVKLTNCTASVLRLKGTMRVQSYREGADVKICFNFEGKPEIKVQVKPLNPYQEANDLVDLGVVEYNVRNSICMAKTVFTVTHLLMPGDLHTMNHDVRSAGGGAPGGGAGPASPKPRNTSQPPPLTPQQQQQQQQQLQQKYEQQQQEQRQLQQQRQKYLQQYQEPAVAVEEPEETLISTDLPVNEQIIPVQNVSRQFHAAPSPELRQAIDQVPRRDQQRVRPQSRPEPMFEPVEAPQQLFQFGPQVQSSPPKPPMVGDKRLLVKVIKANGLTVRQQGAANIVCMVSTDEPVQGYATSIVKNTQNPFWDEHFIFDITRESQEVRVEIYDKDEFIGEAIVYVEDLRKTPSSRQILRLHPQPGNFEYNSGTVTAEFLFMDPAEADLLLDSMNTSASNQLSPRRRIEVARSVTPGGTLVTKTTTTTQRPQYGRHDPGLDGSPNYIEKNMYTDDSPKFSYPESPSNVSSVTILTNGAAEESVAQAALRDLTERRRLAGPQPKSSTIIITGVKRTIESYPADDAHQYPGTQDLNQAQPIALKDDLDLVRPRPQQPEEDTSPSNNLKKSRTLGGSLKKLFRRSRKRSKSRGTGEGEQSRESSLSRGSRSKNQSRENSLSRTSQREYDQRASSVS